MTFGVYSHRFKILYLKTTGKSDILLLGQESVSTSYSCLGVGALFAVIQILLMSEAPGSEIRFRPSTLVDCRNA